MAIVLDTPAQIEHFRLLSLRGRLKLEKLGMTHSIGLAIRPMLSKELGLKPRDSYDKYIAAVQVKIDKSSAEAKNG